MRPHLLAHRHSRPRVGLRCAVLALIVTAVLPAVALGASAGRTLSYRGYRLVVPAGWPVFRLQAHRTACVRFNRHAVYLGVPSADQHCPASALGRTEAILVSPSRAGANPAGVVVPTTTAGTNQGSAARLVDAAHHVVVTATWGRHPGVIQRALGRRALTRATAATALAHPASEVAYAQAQSRAFARARTAAVTVSQPGQVYTGSGFDACNTPSSSQMSAWGSSPYRALGVYIGGANMACSQPNLTATWVSQQSAAGWHLIPIYVGLQAPSNSCGCASVSSSTSTAASQGAAAAQNAVTDMQAIGLGPGNPVYDDMESYNRGGSNTAAVLAFLSAWTTQLHASGYKSGIYSSSDSGVSDLVANYGTGYAEPDEIWIANWNNAANTSDGNVPSQDWPSHQRLHQYNGAHNETYQGVTINIDGDYLDAATAAAGTGTGVATTPSPAPAPSLSVSAGPSGTLNLTPSWRYATGITAWQVIAGSSPTSLTWSGPVVGTGAVPIVVNSAFPYFAVQALGAGGQLLGSSTPVADPAHLAIFGSSVFAPRRGLGAVPVGCYSVNPCTVATTISVGRTTLATTGPERLVAGSGLAYFQLTATAQALLRRTAQRQMAARITVRSTSGASVTRTLTLTSFTTADPGPPRTISQAAQIRFIGTTEFVSHGWVGGILVSCSAGAPCQTTAKLVAAGKVIAQTRAGTIGAGLLGYLFFTLTPAGHTLLAHAKSNQLGATITLTNTGGGTAAAPGAGSALSPGTLSSTTATARVALVAFP